MNSTKPGSTIPRWSFRTENRCSSSGRAWCGSSKTHRAELDAADHVLIVAHGLINRMFLSVLLQVDPQRARYFSQDNTAVNLFSWRGPRIYCDFWNLTCHL